MRAIRNSYLAFLAANVLDILSSLGAHEANPLMQDGGGYFYLWHAVVVKLSITFLLLSMSWVFFEIGNAWNRKAGIVAAALVPCWFTWALLHVFLSNIFGRLGWY